MNKTELLSTYTAEQLADMVVNANTILDIFRFSDDLKKSVLFENPLDIAYKTELSIKQSEIDRLQSEVEKYRKAFEDAKNERDCKIAEYQKKIEELEKPVTENKVNLQWGQREILGVKMENLQMTADNILREVKCLEQRKKMFEDKERRTPRLYANAIIEDASDFHNFGGDDKMHEKAEMRRVDFLREIAEHLLVYCNHNGEDN